MNKSMESSSISVSTSSPQPQIKTTTTTATSVSQQSATSTLTPAAVVKPAVNGINNTPQIVPTSTVNSATTTTTTATTASIILGTSNGTSGNVNNNVPTLTSTSGPDITVIRREIKSSMVMEPVRKEKAPVTNTSSSSSITTTTTSSVDGIASTKSTSTTTTNSSSSSSSSIPVTTSATAAATSTNANTKTVTVGPTTTIPTATNKESKGPSNTSDPGKDEKSVENSNSNSKMESRNQMILNPLKPNIVNSTSSSSTSSANKPLSQDVNNSINQNKNKAPEPAPLGKDVTTVIGRIEQVRGLTGSSQVSAGGPTPSPRSAGGLGAGKASDVNSTGEKPERPPRTRTAHDFGFGTSVEGTNPNSNPNPNQRIRARTTTSARAASASASASPSAKSTLSSHRVSTTVSAKSFAEASHNNNVRNKSERPATSYTRPTSSSTFKGISNYSPSTTLKSNRSYSAIRTHQKMGDAAGDATPAAAGEKPAEKPATLKDQFAAFCRFGDTSSDGKSISLSNSDKWLKQAKIIDGKKITTTDTSISFKKLFKTAKKVNFEDYKKYLEDLATSKKIEVSEIHEKLINCGPPGLSSATRSAHVGVVERLTDTSKYTGSHKERFDSSGKGKGIEGRRDVKDASGYVQGAKIGQK